MKKGDIVLVEHSLNGELLSSTKGKLMWVYETEASLQDSDNPQSYMVFNPLDTDYKVSVLVDSAPSFQSQVASMSDEDLFNAVNTLRGGRIHVPTPPKAKKAREPKLSTEEAQLQALLATMTPQQQQELKVKLGIGG